MIPGANIEKSMRNRKNSKVGGKKLKMMKKIFVQREKARKALLISEFIAFIGFHLES